MKENDVIHFCILSSFEGTPEIKVKDTIHPPALD